MLRRISLTAPTRNFFKRNFMEERIDAGHWQSNRIPDRIAGAGLDIDRPVLGRGDGNWSHIRNMRSLGRSKAPVDIRGLVAEPFFRGENWTVGWSPVVFSAVQPDLRKSGRIFSRVDQYWKKHEDDSWQSGRRNRHAFRALPCAENEVERWDCLQAMEDRAGAQLSRSACFGPGEALSRRKEGCPCLENCERMDSKA